MKIARTGALLGLLVAIAACGCTSFKRYLYEGGDRDSWQHPEEVLRALDIEPGDRIADIGAGGGYFAFRFADAVGPQGMVYAADIDRGMTDYLRERVQQEGRQNLIVVDADVDDPALPTQVDLLFLCNTYHHIDDPQRYFEDAARYLVEGGRLAVIDYKRYGWFQALFGHYTPADTLRAQIEDAGYGFQAEHRFLPRQSFLVFTRPGRD